MTEPTDLLTAPEAARLLGVAGSTVRRWANAGTIHYVRLPSGALRFWRSDIEAILNPMGVSDGR